MTAVHPRIPSVRDMLAGLVAIPSVSSTSAAHDQPNRPVIDCLAGWLEDLGFTVRIDPVPDRPGKANLVARRGAGPGGLALAGHVDTVPCAPALWSSDPFRLTERDDRWHGLGTCDMKGFFALALEAARRLDGAELAEPLWIIATADEESSMSGARALADAPGPLARCAVIGEPTGGRPVRMHKGIVMLGVDVHGVSGHSSDPDLGLNALDVMHAALAEILALRADLARNHRHAAFAVETPTLNLGCLHGGDNPNRICGHAALQMDLRVLPGMQADDVLAELRTRLDRVADRTGARIELGRLFPGVPAWETPADAPLVRDLEALTGQPAGSVAFGTEAPFFSALGMQVAVYGPGGIAQAHHSDEYLDPATLEPTLAVLDGLVARVCRPHGRRVAT